jgi:hypothetical protein
VVFSERATGRGEERHRGEYLTPGWGAVRVRGLARGVHHGAHGGHEGFLGVGWRAGVATE